MRFGLYNKLALCGLVALGLHSCNDDSDAANDIVKNWHVRNTLWFTEAVDSAKTAIKEAKSQYGEEWEDKCQWRLYRSLMYSPDYVGAYDDNIVCKIIRKGNGTFCPTSTDSVSIHFRGWLMPATYGTANYDGKMTTFTQTYYGDFNPATSTPQLMSVGATVEGFQLALQNMVEGDEWDVYIPAKMAYKENASSVIPAYSTLLYRIYMVGAYESGSGTTPRR